MRTLYFLEPGQKLNDVKPSERKRALLVTKEEWGKFGEHLGRQQRRLEEAEREKEELERRKMISKDMAKTWDNTIVNIRKRRIENRRNQIAQLEKDRRRRFLEMRKEEADNKKKIIEEAQRILRLDKDNSKSLISSLKFSEVLREREEQLKFEKKLKEMEEAKEKEYADKIWADAAKYKQELREERERELAKKNKLNKDVRTEMAELLEKKAREEELERRLDEEDNMKVREEMRIIEENEKKEKERKKQLIKADVEENRKLIAEYEAQCKREKEEEEAAIHIHAETKKRIARIKRQKEKEEALANQERREKISDAVAAVVADKTNEENRIIQKAIAEREAKEEEISKKKAAYREALVHEVRRERERQLKQEEEEKMREKELLKLSLMQRLKSSEVNKEFTNRMQELKKKNFKNNRALWDKQCEELEATKAAERSDDVDAVARSVACWNLEDKIFLEYADQLLEESRQKSRPLLPMLKYIEQFKKDVGLTARPKQHKMWQSRVPINNKMFECKAVRKQEMKPWPASSDLNKDAVTL